MFSILQITDPHLFADDAGRLRGVNTDRSFAAVLRAARAKHWPPDLIVLSGDLCQDELAPTYARLCDLLVELDVPVLSLPGNHDSPTHMRTFLDRGKLRYCRPVTLGNWRCVPLDSRVDGQVGGFLDKQQLALVRDALSDPEIDNILLFLHHQPLPCGSRWLDGIGLQNAQELLDLVDASERIRGVFWGHVHQQFECWRGHTLFASTPSTCAQFLPDSDKFALDDRPPAYRLLRLRGDGNLESEVHWVAHSDDG